MKLIDNRDVLLGLLPKGMVVAELGVFKGVFSDVLLSVLCPSRLFLVDLFPSVMCSGDRDGNNVEWVDLSLVYPVLLDKYKCVDGVVSVVRQSSGGFLGSLVDGFLDMVYIDADHSYEGVCVDLELCRCKVRVGGFICGHDYCGLFPGVVRAVDEFCVRYGLCIEYVTADGCPSYLIRNL